MHNFHRLIELEDCYYTILDNFLVVKQYQQQILQFITMYGDLSLPKKNWLLQWAKSLPREEPS